MLPVFAALNAYQKQCTELAFMKLAPLIGIYRYLQAIFIYSASIAHRKPLTGL